MPLISFPLPQGLLRKTKINQKVYDMKTSEVRDLSEKEQEEKVGDLREELFNLRFQLATGKIENPGQLRMLRRDIARIKTIQRERVAKKKSQEDQNAQITSKKG